MTSDNVVGWVCAAVGVFTIAGAVQNWEWFMNSRKAWLVVKLFGRGGARIFYGVLGLAFLAGGTLVGLGVIQ